MIRLGIDFVEAFLTVFVPTIGAVMVESGSYILPTWPAILFGSLGGLLAGVRRIQARLSNSLVR